jgi:poly-gamma-glutamate capsule biosynthesis protein CapA/YwtB (metallophosphatase superfamily)
MGRDTVDGPRTPSLAQDHRIAVTLTAVGDIMLGRGVKKYLDTEGYAYPFLLVQDALRNSDLTFGNLELPLSSRGVLHPTKRLGFPAFRADPAAVEGLLTAGFNVLSLANNHILDYGQQALLDTMVVLQESGISHVGVGRNMNAARAPVFLQVRDLKIAFLAYCSFYGATAHQVGTAPLEPKLMQEDVRTARQAADVVVVSLHFGIEYSPCPLPRHRAIAHSLVDAGATLILGHHPHLLQGIERYRNSLIVYSLGDFVFDSSDEDVMRRKIDESRFAEIIRRVFAPEHLRLDESFILRCMLTTRGVESFDLLPVRISSTCQPALVTGSERAHILRRVESLSALLQDKTFTGAQELQDAELEWQLRQRFQGKPMHLLTRLHRLRWPHIRLAMVTLRRKMLAHGGRNR